MKLFRKIMAYGLIGIGIGNVTVLIFSLIYGDYILGTPEFLSNVGSANKAAVIQTVIYALLGVIQGVASEIMKNTEQAGLVKSSLIHYLLVIVPLLLAGYYLRWFNSVSTLLAMLVFSSLVYVVIWAISYLSIKNDIQKINSKLNNN